MKSQKGMSLISLTIYIIAMVIIVAIIAVVSSYFYTNIDATEGILNPLTEYTKFNSFFSDEVNHANIKVLECQDNYVVFDNGIQYTFVNQGIYRNQVKVCQGVEKCKFTYQIKNGKNVVTVAIKIKNTEEKTVDYTLKN